MTIPLILNPVDVGLTPNDGTGNNIRDAFVKINENSSNLFNYLDNGPAFSSANVAGVLSTDTLLANVAILSTSLTLEGNIPSTTTNNGTLIVVGGTGISGNLNVGGSITAGSENGTFFGNIQGSQGTFVNFASYSDAVFGGNIGVAKNVTINGALTVFGNITTVTTSELFISDPTIALGGNANIALSYNDGENRGVDFYWYDTVGNVQQLGFFGFQNSTQEFIYTPTATSGPGDAVFRNVTANILSTGTSTFNTAIANTVIAYSGIAGELTSAAQPNITTIGTLDNLSVTGNVVIGSPTDGAMGAGTINATGLYVNGVAVATSISAFDGGNVHQITNFLNSTISTNPTTGAITVVGGVGVQGDINVGGNVSATSVTSTSFIGNITTSDQPYITSLGTLGNLTVAGTVNANAVSATNLIASNSVNASILSASVGIAGTLSTAAQPNVTSLGVLGSLNVGGTAAANLFSGNVLGNVTGSITGSADTVTNPAQPAITSVGNLTVLTVNGATTVGSLNAGSGTIQTTGNITTTNSLIGTTIYGTLQTAAQPAITSLGTLTGLTITGSAAVLGNITAASAILAAGAGTQAIGSPTNRFGTLYSTAINNSSVINTGSLNGAIGLANPAAGFFTTLSANGNVTLPTLGTGIRFPDNSYQYTAYVPGIGTFTGLNISSNITLSPGATIIFGDSTVQTTAASTTVELTANVGHSLVLRDNSGSFSAGTITASMFSGSGASLTLIPNGALVNSSITVNAGTGLSGGGGASLGGSTTLSLPTVGTPMSDSFSKITTDTQGRVSANTLVMSSDIISVLGASPVNAASAITITDNTSFGSTVYPVWVSSVSGSQTESTSSTKLSFVPSTGTLSSTTFVGNVSGNVTGNITGNLLGNVTGNVIGNITGNVTGNISGSASTVTSSAQLAITSVGTLTSLSVTGNITTSGNIVGTIYGSGANLTSIPNSALVNSSVTVNTSTGISGGGPIVLGGNITLTNTGVTSLASGGHITASSSTGAITLGSDATNANTPSTIVARDASGNFSANVITATTTNARYADLAEKYQSDGQYDPGTVLVFGGTYEVTTTGHMADVSVAGVVSTAPAYLMNIDEQHSVAVALRGKVPVKVIGAVTKGDLLVTSATPGYAESVGRDIKYGVAVFAKSLETNLTPGMKLINAVII